MGHPGLGKANLTAPDTFRASLWSALTPAQPPLPAAVGAMRADVVVVGGGLLGLSLALHLAERRTDVILLEAEEIGYGASGRNTGFVVPWLKSGLSLEYISARIGTESAERLLRLVTGSGEALFALVRRLGIACDAEPNGWLQPALDQAGADRIAGQLREAERLGVCVQGLDAAEARHATGVPGYTAALLIPSGGQINPLSYAHGLASAASTAGARLLQGRASTISRQGTNWRVTTQAGATVDAGITVLATNALVGLLEARVARSILPARSYQVATQTLDETFRRWLLPGRQPLADLRHHPFALRWSPDNRLVTGGGAVLNDRWAGPRMARVFLHRLTRLVPGLPQLRGEYAWNGVVAGTGDFLPRLWSLEPGLFAPIGCNGRGVALTTAFGAALATYLNNGETDVLPIAPAPPRPWKLHGLMRFAPSAWLAAAWWRDWRAERSRRRKPTGSGEP
jgi:glycine/D-amino acid oxidase-like deaminating enzyme